MIMNLQGVEPSSPADTSNLTPDLRLQIDQRSTIFLPGNTHSRASPITCPRNPPANPPPTAASAGPAPPPDSPNEPPKYNRTKAGKLGGNVKKCKTTLAAKASLRKKSAGSKGLGPRIISVSLYQTLVTIDRQATTEPAHPTALAGNKGGTEGRERKEKKRNRKAFCLTRLRGGGGGYRG